MSVAASRAAAVAIAVAILFGLVALREATSPSGEGFRPAVAAAPEGGMYLVDEAHRCLRVVRPSAAGPCRSLPAGILHALAADGDVFLLAAEGALWRSADAGKTWRIVLSGSRFTVASLRDGVGLVGAWGVALWRSDDAGLTWSRAAVPPGDLEFESIVPGYAATLLGLLHSGDGGRSWNRLEGFPNRMTAVSLTGTETDPVRAGDWRGGLWAYNPIGGRAVSLGRVSGGVWSIEKSVAGTTTGIVPVTGPNDPLGRREVTRVVLSEPNYFAIAADGRVYWSLTGTGWRLVQG